MDIKGTLKKATNIFQRDVDMYDKCLIESEKHSLCKIILFHTKRLGEKKKKKKREQTSVNHNKNAKPRSKLLWPITKSKPNNPKAFEEHSPI